MNIELKIKAKHLALEPGVIRHEEEKLKKRIKYSQDSQEKQALINQPNKLSQHHKWDVRNEARATQLARIYLAGKPYSFAGSKRKDEYLFENYITPRIVRMVTKYGIGDQCKVDKADIKEWAKI